MKRFQISETEKKQILTKHQNFKKILEEKLEKTKSGILISEQRLSGNALLEKAKKVCTKLQNAGWKSFNSPEKFLLIVATQDGTYYKTGDYLLFSSRRNAAGDLTYLVYDKNYKLKSTQPWFCKKLYEEEQAINDQSCKQKIDKEGWMTYDEAIKQGLDLQQSTSEMICGTKYYKAKGQTFGKLESVAAQKEVADWITEHLKGDRYVPDGSIDPKDACWAFPKDKPYGSDWQDYTLNTGTEAQRFNVKEFKIVINPSCAKKQRETITKNVASSTSNVSKNPKECKTAIETYWSSFIEGGDTTTADFQDTKRLVQGCKARYCRPAKGNGRCAGDWDLGIFGGAKRMDALMDFFAGYESYDGREIPRRNSPYALK